MAAPGPISPPAPSADDPSGRAVGASAGRNASLVALQAFFTQHRRIVALTGAGVSTASGLPAYRDADGNWRHAQPITIQDFVGSSAARRRYWLRSGAGWPRFAAALPNGAHRALARLEAEGRLTHVITQNVDGLHQRAGSRRVTDLHGRLDRIRCLGCGALRGREDVQAELAPWLPPPDTVGAAAPDGDVPVSGLPPVDFPVPTCECGGLLKPDVVFFGEAIPPVVSAEAEERVRDADALLVVGTSLMVFSGYRLVRDAASAGKSVAAINQGRTRADNLIGLKVYGDCSALLPALTGTAGVT